MLQIDIIDFPRCPGPSLRSSQLPYRECYCLAIEVLPLGLYYLDHIASVAGRGGLGHFCSFHPGRYPGPRRHWSPINPGIAPEETYRGLGKGRRGKGRPKCQDRDRQEQGRLLHRSPSPFSLPRAPDARGCLGKPQSHLKRRVY